MNPIPEISNTTNLPLPRVSDLEIYSESGKNYLVKVNNGEFIVMNESTLQRHLITLGFSNMKVNGLSQLQRVIHYIQTEKNVSYSGPLAGYNNGIKEVFGKKILVMGEAHFIKPTETDWTIIRTIIENMFSDSPLQIDYFYSWLKHAYVPLTTGQITQGQLLALAGPKNCGKTLLQAIIRLVLGGREANPYAYMTGRTDFNRDIFGAELLSFGDEVASTDYRNRVKFGSMIKQFVVNESQRCHGKGREAITLNPFWRVVMSINDESSGLQVLPPLDVESMTDKVTLLRVNRPKFFEESIWKNGTRSENWKLITDAIPGFLSFLSKYDIPQPLRDTRLGVIAYQNPDLLLDLGCESPASRLLEYIDMTDLLIEPSVSNIRLRSPREWTGTASMLERYLRLNCEIKNQVDRLLNYSSACGGYLSDLVRTNPNRVECLKVVHGTKQYKINPKIKNETK